MKNQEKRTLRWWLTIFWYALLEECIGMKLEKDGRINRKAIFPALIFLAIACFIIFYVVPHYARH